MLRVARNHFRNARIIFFNYYYYLLRLETASPIHTPFMAGSSYPFYSGVAKEAVGWGAKIVETEVAF